MSWLGAGTKMLHNYDWGHNHLCGDGTPESDEFWAKIMAEHMAEHLRLYREGLEPPIPQSWHRFEDFPS